MSRHVISMVAVALLGVLQPAQGYAQAPALSSPDAVTTAEAEGSVPAGADPDAAAMGDTVAAAQGEPPEPTVAADNPVGSADMSDAQSAPPEPEGSVESVGSDDAEYSLSEAELAALGFASGPGEEATVDTSLSITGFIDFSFVSYVGDKNWRNAAGPHPSFYIGNLNLYVAKNITEDVRTFAEIRFMYLPNGSSLFTEGRYERAVAVDYNEGQGALHWGGIEIERVYLEWRLHRYLSVRAGQFLTPYGIWNVDHGSPTIVSVTRPNPINIALFPERQTGLELFGRAALSAEHAIGYHLTLSNGLGPATEFRDLDGNKAIGGRLYWSFDGLGALRIGVSGFYGRDTSANLALSLSPQGKLVAEQAIETQSDVLSLAADVQWRYGGLLLQAEFISQQRKFTPGGRSGFVHPLLGEYIAAKDTSSYGGYALIGYRFSWLGIMPYFIFSNLDYVEPYQQSLVKTRTFQVGVNIRPLDSVVLKLQYDRGVWPDGHLVSDAPIQLVAAQLAWAF